MNSIAIITFCALVAYSNAGVLVGPTAKILQGPSSKTTIVGPEGSVISAVAPGGQIVHEEHPGVEAHASPIISYAAPVITHAAPIVAHSVPSTVLAHSSAYEHSDVIVAGPSGTIASGKSIHAAPIVVKSSPFEAHAAPFVAHAVPVLAYNSPSLTLVSHDVDDNGHEGQYVHDNIESLYDDGSYKAQH